MWVLGADTKVRFTKGTILPSGSFHLGLHECGRGQTQIACAGGQEGVSTEVQTREPDLARPSVAPPSPTCSDFLICVTGQKITLLPRTTPPPSRWSKVTVPSAYYVSWADRWYSYRCYWNVCGGGGWRGFKNYFWATGEKNLYYFQNIYSVVF